MTGFEERLRSALAGLADEVPPSRNALAEHERRLAMAARRVRRRPMLAAAAAAVVIAATVPATVAPQHGGPPPPADRGGPAGYDPALDGPWLSRIEGPFGVGEFDDGGRRWQALAAIERHPDGRDWNYRVCVVAVPPGRPINDPGRHPDSAGCIAPPSGDRKVETSAVLTGRDPASGPGLLLFLAVPAVTELEVRAGDGAPVPAPRAFHNEDVALFSADFGGSVEGFGYTARDDAGNVVESAIS